MVAATHEPPTERLRQAEELKNAKQIEQAIALYSGVLAEPSDNDQIIKEQEYAIVHLGQLYRDLGLAQELAQLIRSSRSFMGAIAKAKTAKLIRTLVDYFSDIPNCLPLQIDVCKETIEWSVQEKRIFLKQSLETRLVALYLDNKMYHESLNLISQLLKELKRLDDKMVLVEVQLLESRVCHALRNLPKSRAALTSARTSANAIYCPPLLQAALDMQSGVLHSEEKDYKTGYSYFFEAFEGYSSQDDPKAVLALKYMLLCKIMLNLPEDIQAILSGKTALRYSGSDIEAMKLLPVHIKTETCRNSKLHWQLIHMSLMMILSSDHNWQHCMTPFLNKTWCASLNHFLELRFPILQTLSNSQHSKWKQNFHK